MIGLGILFCGEWKGRRLGFRGVGGKSGESFVRRMLLVSEHLIYVIPPLGEIQ